MPLFVSLVYMKVTTFSFVLKSCAFPTPASTELESITLLTENLYYYFTNCCVRHLCFSTVDLSIC